MPNEFVARRLAIGLAATCLVAVSSVHATPPEAITAESKNAWLILYNADSSGLDANSNGINDSEEWKDWFISTHGISQPKTLGLVDPDGFWNKEWAGMQEDYATTTGLWGQVVDYLDTNTNADEIIGILVGYNVPGIWDVYTRNGEGISISFRRGAKSVASSLSLITASPPAGGTGFLTNPLSPPVDFNFWTCGFARPSTRIPTTGNLTKAILLDSGLSRMFITARIDGPTLEDAKDLTRRAIKISSGETAIRPEERVMQDYVDERENLPFWSDLGGAVEGAHRDLSWGKFMFDDVADFDSSGAKECDVMPCGPPIRAKNDVAWFGYEYNNGWAYDDDNDGIGDRTFAGLCQSPVGTRVFACAWISWGGVTLRYRSTDPRPVLAYTANPPINPDYLTTNNLTWVHSQFSFNALWPDCDGDGNNDETGGFAAIIASPTCEPGTVGFLHPGLFLERVRNGATLAEASLIASPRLQHKYEYVGDPFLKLPRPLPTDCNTNGVDDYVEVLAGSGTDFNSNGILDACEKDCDGDGVNNICELVRSLKPNCNGNAAPDTCDICAGTSTDCDFNLIPDECDIAMGSATDLNSNGLADTCEDCNTNGIPDFLPGECAGFGDYDRDNDSDLVDFAALQRCFGLSGGLLTNECACAFDYGALFDDVIDLDDVIDFVDQLDSGQGPGSGGYCWESIQAQRYANICVEQPQ